jgi:hypothetical protein
MNGLKTIERASVPVRAVTKLVWHLLAHARANGKALPESSKAALVITAEPKVRAALRQALPPDWRLIPADTLYQAIEVIRRDAVRIVFFDREVRDRIGERQFQCCPTLLFARV